MLIILVATLAVFFLAIALGKPTSWEEQISQLQDNLASLFTKRETEQLKRVPIYVVDDSRRNNLPR